MVAPTKQTTPLASLFLLTFIFYLNFFSRIIFSPLLPELEQDLSLTHGEAGSLFLILSCGYFISLAGSGFISARLYHKRTITCSMLMISGSLWLMSATSSFPVIKAAFFFLGLSAGMYLPSAIATISDLFSPHQWGRAFGVHELAPNLAFLTAPLLTVMLLPHLHWQQYILVLTLFSILSAILYAMFGKGARLQGARPNLHHCRTFVRMPEFWVMVLLFSMGIAGTLGVYSILPIFLVREHGLSEQSANMLVGLSRSTTLITALLGGMLADRFGNHRTMAAVLLLTGLATALLGLGQEAMIGFRVWLQPVVAVCFFPPAFAMLSNVGSPETRNVVISLTIPTSFVVGGGLIPALISRMADMGLFSLGLILTGLFICSGSMLIRLMPDKQQQQ